MQPRVSSPPRITIALCTLNGAAHLAAQLASYAAQNHTAWDLWISDDGSCDGTRALLEDFAARHGAGRDIRVLHGPQRGVAANFLSLLCHPGLPVQPVALSDQDDVWLPEKLGLGLACIGGDAPCLYGAQSIHTDARLRPVGRSLGGGVPGFANALIQNIVSGHSAMLNAPALALVRAAGVPEGVPYHDWWLYQLVTGAGGTVIVRPEAVLMYRQHGANAMGSRQGLRAAVVRTAQVFGCTYGAWVAANTAALRQVAPLLTPAARATLDALAATPQRIGLARLRSFRRFGIRRQGRTSTALLWLAVLSGRV
jgi:glycosyltransferase involved in cell wall biosynthesis